MRWFNRFFKCKHPAEKLTIASDTSKDLVDDETIRVGVHFICKCGCKVNFIYLAVTGKKGDELALRMAQSAIKQIMEGSKNA